MSQIMHFCPTLACTTPILIFGPQEHHLYNESNHQYRRLGHGLCQRLSSGSWWRSVGESVLDFLVDPPLSFSKPNEF